MCSLPAFFYWLCESVGRGSTQVLVAVDVSASGVCSLRRANDQAKCECSTSQMSFRFLLFACERAGVAVRHVSCSVFATTALDNPSEFMVQRGVAQHTWLIPLDEKLIINSQKEDNDKKRRRVLPFGLEKLGFVMEVPTKERDSYSDGEKTASQDTDEDLGGNDERSTSSESEEKEKDEAKEEKRQCGINGHGVGRDAKCVLCKAIFKCTTKQRNALHMCFFCFSGGNYQRDTALVRAFHAEAAVRPLHPRGLRC